MAPNLQEVGSAASGMAHALRDTEAYRATMRLLDDLLPGAKSTGLTEATAEGIMPIGSARITRALSMRDLIHQPVPGELPELTSFGDPATHITNATSMRALVQQGKIDKVERYVNESYFPQLQRVFPASEIETPDTYMGYLKNPKHSWDMIGLHNPESDVLGGIQFQTVNVGGEAINKAAWGEHVWLRQEARNQPNFRTLIGTTRDRIVGTGANHTFMEYNDPLKMSEAEIAEDMATGIAPNRRVNLWNRVGIHVAVGNDGKPFFYAQPSMDGLKESHAAVIDKLADLNGAVERNKIAFRSGSPEIPNEQYDALKTYRDRVQRVADKIDAIRDEGGVKFLSLGHIRATPLSGIGADGKPFNETMPMLDTLKLQHAAHRTIDGVRIPETMLPDLVRAHEDGQLLQGVRRYKGIADPVALEYTADSIGSGTKTLTFVPLKQIYGPLFNMQM